MVSTPCSCRCKVSWIHSWTSKAEIRGLYLSQLQTTAFSSLPLCTLGSSHYNLNLSTQSTQNQIACSVSTIHIEHTISAAALPPSLAVSVRPVAIGFLFILSVKSTRNPLHKYRPLTLDFVSCLTGSETTPNLHSTFSNNKNFRLLQNQNLSRNKIESGKNKLNERVCAQTAIFRYTRIDQKPQLFLTIYKFWMIVEQNTSFTITIGRWCKTLVLYPTI